MDIQTPPFLELHNAVVQRAGAPILTVDSFRLEEREHLALLGPNGSGKSTFVKLITREVLPLHREVPPVRFRGSERAFLLSVSEIADPCCAVFLGHKSVPDTALCRSHGA